MIGYLIQAMESTDSIEYATQLLTMIDELED